MQSPQSSRNVNCSKKTRSNVVHMKIVFSVFSKTMKITTILLVFIFLGSGLSLSKLDYDTTKSSLQNKRFSSFYDSGNYLAFTKGFGGKLTLNKQKSIETSTLQRKYTLFRNKRFVLNEMFQRNASKFAIFYV